MSMWRDRVRLQVLCSFVFLCAPFWAQAPQTADQKLATGVLLIDDNCGENEGSSVSEFDRGVALVEEALREGAKDRRKGLLALIDGYSEYAFSYDRARPMSDATRASWHSRLADVYKELLRDEPGNVSLLLRYVGVVKDEQERLQIYQHILQIQPNTAEAAFGLALVHANTDRLPLDASRVKMGVGEFIRALGLRSADAEMIQLYLGGIARDLGRAIFLSGGAPEGEEYKECLARVYAAAAEALRKRAAAKQP